MSTQDPGAPTPPLVPGQADYGLQDHALRHQTQDTRTYPCNTCGSQLQFDIASQQLKCLSCGNVQPLVEGEGEVVEKDLRAALQQPEARETAAQGLVAGEKEIVCQNCGGHTTFTGTWTAQRCPYCATPIQRDDVHAAPQRLPVDGILPFTVDEKRAKDALSTWVSNRRFAPREFKDYGRAGSFASVYSAYFTFDAEADTAYRGERGDNYTRTVGSGDDQRTVTETRWRKTSGNVHNSFDDLAILANDGLNRKHVTALEPWPTSTVKPFSPEYIAGHLSRTYDHSVEECYAEAQKSMESQIDSTIKTDIGGDHQKIHSKQTSWGTMTFKHLLLPIWLLTVIYAGQTYQVMINGVTGEVHGERPYSKVKIAAAVVAALIVAIILAVVFTRGN
ncbi:MAG: hypothetical protein ACR2HR_18185 [Euzebya sp.]